MAYGLRFNRKGIDHATHELTTNIKKTSYNLVICEGFGSFGVILEEKLDFKTLSIRKRLGIHTFTNYVNVKIYRLKLFYVNVSICENLIFLIYRTKISPLIIGEVIPSVYKEDTKISPMINGEIILSV